MGAEERCGVRSEGIRACCEVMVEEGELERGERRASRDCRMGGVEKPVEAREGERACVESIEMVGLAIVGFFDGRIVDGSEVC